MNKLDDGRISKFQRQIYDWLKELYPSLTIEMEKLIPSTNQRIDIYIESLRLAVECDGTFHDKPTGFYVKDQQQWQDIIDRDKKKEYDLFHHGIKLVRIPYNHKFKCAQDLELYINSIEYSNIPFNNSIFEYENDFKKEQLIKGRQIQSKKYKDFMDENKEDLRIKRKSEYQRIKSQRVVTEEDKEVLKLRRKEQYKKAKDSRKEYERNKNK